MAYLRAVTTTKRTLGSLVWVTGGIRVHVILIDVDRKSNFLGLPVRVIVQMFVMIWVYFIGNPKFVNIVQNMTILKDVVQLCKAGYPQEGPVK